MVLILIPCTQSAQELQGVGGIGCVGQESERTKYPMAGHAQFPSVVQLCAFGDYGQRAAGLSCLSELLDMLCVKRDVLDKKQNCVARGINSKRILDSGFFCSLCCVSVDGAAIYLSL